MFFESAHLFPVHRDLRIFCITRSFSSIYFTEPLSTLLFYHLSLFKFSLFELSVFSLLLYRFGVFFFCPHCLEQNTLTSSIISPYAISVLISTLYANGKPSGLHWTEEFSKEKGQKYLHC